LKITIGTTRPFHLVHLSRELADLGHDVTVYGYMPEKKFKSYGVGNARYISAFASLLPYSGLAFQRLSYSIQRASTEILLERMDNFIAKNMTPCDVYIGLSGMSICSAKVAKKKFGALTISDRGSTHVLKQANLLIDSNEENLTKRYINRELNSYSSSDYVSVPSIFAKDSFIDNGYPESRLFLNNYGVNIKRFQPNRNIVNEKLKVLFVGGWSYRKGCDYIINSIRSLPSVTLTHVGSISDFDFPKDAQFNSIGHVNNEDLGAIYNQHDVLLLPSREDGFGMVMLEALACGTPVIASKNTGAPDIRFALESPHSVTVMEVLSGDALAEKLASLSLNVSHFRSINNSLTGRDRDYFSWCEYGKRYEQFLLSCLSKR